MATSPSFQIRFRSESPYGRTLAFPCDERGKVDMDRLSEDGKRDYLFARIMVRHECSRTEVVPALAALVG